MYDWRKTLRELALGLAQAANMDEYEERISDVLDLFAQGYALLCEAQPGEGRHLFVVKIPENRVLVTGTVVPDDAGIVLQEAIKAIGEIDPKPLYGRD